MQAFGGHIECRDTKQIESKIIVRLAALLFVIAVAFRIFYVFITPPYNHILSDPKRHWLNSGNFFTPEFFGSMDPIMYQAFLAFVRYITSENPFGVTFCVGILSALLPWFWYRALKELVPTLWALVGGTAIAIMPSLLMIYSYFMQETLLLTLCAAATWLSLRSLRLQTLSSFAWAAFIWTLACYTRILALPMAGMFLGLLVLAATNHKLLRLGLAAGVFTLLLLPACWHSMLRLNYCEPFGNTYLNQTYRLSQKQRYSLTVRGDSIHVFIAPNYLNHPLAPFSQWTTPRRGIVHVEIDPAYGRRDWELELERIRQDPKPLSGLQEWAENALNLFMDPSWPDSNRKYWLGWLSRQSRWLILPMTLFVGVMGLRYYSRMPWRQLILPTVALVLMSILLLQQRFIVEGRYRKVIEPILIASCIIFLHGRRRLQQQPEI